MLSQKQLIVFERKYEGRIKALEDTNRLLLHKYNVLVNTITSMNINLREKQVKL